jgi:hypothetical protein
MDGAEGLGTGLAALAFWGFISAMIVGGIWDGAKKRDAQHETLRRMIESGKPVDEDLLKRLMIGEPKRPDRDLAVAAIIMFSIAAGLSVFAQFMSGTSSEASTIVLGVAALVAFIGVGLGLAGAFVWRARTYDRGTGQRTDVG